MENNSTFNAKLLEIALERANKEQKYSESAEEIRALYNAYRCAGFTNEQAFELVKIGLYSATTVK